MMAGVIAVLVNLLGNFVLIYGHFGAPRMGVEGAAVATVLSRFVELAILVIWTHTHPAQNAFAPKLYYSPRIPLRLVGQIFLRGLPLMANEAAWSLGFVAMNQQYSLRGLHVVGAHNISSTFWNVFSVSFMALGIAVGIILGQKLGAGDKEGAREDSRKLIALSVALGVVICVVYSVCSFFIPYLYNTTDQIRHLATYLMLVCALAMPMDAYIHAAYFTLRSGGQAFVTFLFDSCYMWVVNVPFVFVLIQYTSLPMLTVFILSQCTNIIKCFLGGWLVHKGIWIKTIVE
jgi:Na+-driven multidrug efflux pump